MMYSRCLYYVLMRAETEARAACKVSRSDMQRYALHACKLMNTQPISICLGNGLLHMIVELPPTLSLSDFIARLKSFTSSWISPDNNMEYWTQSCWISAISPEDTDEIKNMIESAESNENIQNRVLNAGLSIEPFIPGMDIALCHHIILITNGGKLSLRLKYELLLAESITEICRNLGLPSSTACGHRNHMHILCLIPADHALCPLIDSLKKSLMQWMLSNRHFRKFDGWERSIAFTVSQKRQDQELYQLMHQHEIHHKFAIPNEMSILAPKLRIPFFLSLN